MIIKNIVFQDIHLLFGFSSKMSFHFHMSFKLVVKAPFKAFETARYLTCASYLGV